MSYLSTHPHPSLSKYIYSFWILEGKANDLYVHRVMAGGMAELVFHYKGTFDEFLSNGKLQKSFISGLDAKSQTFKQFSIQQDFSIFGKK